MSLSIEPVPPGESVEATNSTLQEYRQGIVSAIAKFKTDEEKRRRLEEEEEEERMTNEELLRRAYDPLSDTLDCKEVTALCSANRDFRETLGFPGFCREKTFLCRVDHLIRSEIYDDIANSAALEYDETRKNFDSNLFNFVEEPKFQVFQEKAVDEAIASLTADIANFEERVSFKRVLLFLQKTKNREKNLGKLKEKIVHGIPLIRLVRISLLIGDSFLDFYKNPRLYRTVPHLRADYEDILSPGPVYVLTGSLIDIIEARIRNEHDARVKWYEYGVLITNDGGVKKLRIFQERFRDCIKEYCKYENYGTYAPESTYYINNWDVSRVTDMSNAFSGMSDFNQPLNNWDVSNVENMSYMFSYATNFNGCLNGWTITKVETMAGMFSDAANFNRPLNEWTGFESVKNMRNMFTDAVAFNQSLDDWNVAGVTSMYEMFKGATNFNRPLANWKPGSLKDAQGMFKGATSFNQPLNGWKLGSRRHEYTISFFWFSRMFEGATSFNQDLDNWDLKGRYRWETYDMFKGATNFNSELPQNYEDESA